MDWINEEGGFNAEATDMFFGVTKLFQSPDVSLAGSPVVLAAL